MNVIVPLPLPESVFVEADGVAVADGVTGVDAGGGDVEADAALGAADVDAAGFADEHPEIAPHASSKAAGTNIKRCMTKSIPSSRWSCASIGPDGPAAVEFYPGCWRVRQRLQSRLPHTREPSVARARVVPHLPVEEHHCSDVESDADSR